MPVSMYCAGHVWTAVLPHLTWATQQTMPLARLAVGIRSFEPSSPPVSSRWIDPTHVITCRFQVLHDRPETEQRRATRGVSTVLGSTGAYQVYESISASRRGRGPGEALPILFTDLLIVFIYLFLVWSPRRVGQTCRHRREGSCCTCNRRSSSFDFILSRLMLGFVP